MDPVRQRKKLETWRNGLLDLGHRNRMMNYRRTRRGTLHIVAPDFETLFSKIAGSTRAVTFKKRVDVSHDVYLTGFFSLMDSLNAPVELVTGEIGSDLPTEEMQITLRNLRQKAKLSLEEQGINILYLSFGFLEWRQKPSEPPMSSPLVLVPVTIERKTITGGYSLKRLDEDIVVNPTLDYALNTFFGIDLPDFDPEEGILAYLDRVRELIQDSGWSVKQEADLGLLSFLKIVMYRDLMKYENRIFENPVIRAFCGDPSGLTFPDEDAGVFDHDGIPYLDSFQVVNADASQLDAIRMSKQGISFVLMGPPGTGKSQTITNIIAEGLADGKKILFVSEKMAALNVVLNRLRECGLGDYCLALHSCKTEKKSVVQELARTLDEPVIAAPAKDYLSIGRAERERNELRKYYADMYARRSPLGRSVREAVSELIRLSDEPAVILRESDSYAAFDGEKYALSVEALTKYSDFAHKSGENPFTNPWRNTSLDMVTYERMQEIGEVTGALLKALPSLDRVSDGTVGGILSFSEGICEYEDLYAGGRKYVSRIFRDEMCRDQAECELAGLRNMYSRALECGISPEDIKSPERRKQTYAAQKTAWEEVREIGSFIEQTAQASGQALPYTAEGVRRIGELAEILSIPYAMRAEWFGEGVYEKLLTLIRLRKMRSEIVKGSRDDILTEWKEEFLGFETGEIIGRFEKESSSFLRRLGGNYRRDRAALLAMRKSGAPNDDKSLLSGLRALEACREEIIGLVRTDEQCAGLLGGYYNGENTDWDHVEEVLSAAWPAREYTAKYGLSDILAEELEQPVDRRTIRIGGYRPEEVLAGDLLMRYERSAERIGIPLTQRAEILRRQSENGPAAAERAAADISRTLREPERDLEKIEGWLLDFLEEEKAFENRRRELLAYFGGSVFSAGTERRQAGDTTLSVSDEEQALPEDASLSVSDEEQALPEDVSLSVSDEEQALPEDASLSVSDGEQALTEGSSFFPSDEGIRQAGERLVKLLKEAGFPEKGGPGFHTDFMRGSDAAAASGMSAAGQQRRETESRTGKNGTQSDDANRTLRFFTETVRKFFGWFPQDDLTGLSVDDFCEKLRGCSDIEKLYSWLSFEDVWKMCRESGVSDFIDACIGQGINPEHYADVFKKSFYTKWLFDILSKEDARQLRTFRSHVHEALIDRFAADDSDSLRFARERLGEMLTRRKPEARGSVRKGSEMAVLRHEANKKRSIKPIRRLLREIPNLVMSLKPCLMMSPLSVAYFLDPDQYMFDMVIFDEASQILPEDAIGAVCRGKQVIITGDTRQMPPTSFFTTAIKGTEDVDRDEEEFPDEPVSESVLDEAAAWLPSCMLLWHYRSRDESLIAFSNREIYRNKLITFPGCGRQPDRGVEYVLVENGIYRDRTNIAEAEKCVELIREHILQHPDRSLGVVAFSEKQQSVIENAVGRFRLQHPEYEEFFDEEREEPFFVKNLENVQGDERDTILFSICYAKNEQGRMYMRFGPLGAAGGERRLNVAITRAKYNVKLVGSILPEDIDLGRTQAEGVRMLRDYIAFAMAKGMERSFGTERAEEASFEDAVADYILQLGYAVRRNVGASRCRVDIAVGEAGAEKPFFAGIMCDGDNYTMGRTVRERDVLRNGMLKSMGWRMHHVWSFNWFRMPDEEKQRLAAFLEEALKSAEGQEVRADD